MNTRLDSERGSTLPLLMLYCLLALTLIVTLMGATSMYIARKQLYSVADAAALSSAEEFSIRDLSRTNGELSVRMSDERVSRAASRFLEQAKVDRNIRLVRAESPDGTSASVTVATDWRPPILGEFLPLQLNLAVTATARSMFTPSRK
ncbi:MAG: pilus assembly protein TadG-related protein [Agromyces sp.]